MGGDWRVCTLGDVVTLQRGHDLPAHQRNPGSVPVMGSFGLTGSHDESKACGPGVTVGRSGASFGVVNYCPVDYWPLNTALYVRDFHGNHERFIYYLLKNIDFSAYNSGSAQPSLNRNHIHPMSVICPALLDQKAIAHILGSVDDNIELNRKMNEDLEDLARAIFKSWFVDFDPVRAKAEGRKPEGMDDATAALFPDSFEDSELGQIPKGWRAMQVSSFANVIDCLHSKKPEQQNEGQYLLQVYNVGTTGRLDLAKPYFVSPNDYDVWTKRIEVSGNDLVITKTGRVGAVARIRQGFKSGIGRNMVAIRAKDGVAKPLFVADCFFSDRMSREITSNTNDGTILKSLHVKAIEKLQAVLPDLKVQHLYNTKITAFHERLDTNDMENESLAMMRNALLPKLLSGKLRIKDAEKFMENVA